MENIPLHTFAQDDDSSIPFKVVKLETRSTYDTTVPHRHNYYEIFILFKGGGDHEIDFHTYDIKDNSLHFVSPGQVHMVRRELDTYGYVILFSREFYSPSENDRLFEMPFLNLNSPIPILNLSKDDMLLFEPIIRKIAEESNSNEVNKEEILRSYLHILLLLSGRYYKGNGENILIPAVVKEFRMQLEKHFIKYHMVKEYAQLLSISEKKLNDAIKKHTGQTAGEIITERIILEAKRLIKHSELSTKEIAHFLNYSDPAHFSKFFKSKTGLTPGEFKALPSAIK